MVWREGVFDGEGICAAYSSHAHGRVQGAGGSCSNPRGQDHGRAVQAVRGPSHPDHAMEATTACGRGRRLRGGPQSEPVDLVPLHTKIGQLALENDFLEGALTKAGLLSEKR